jgi:hypothetical protein
MSLTYENSEYDLNALFSFDLLKTLLTNLSQSQKNNNDWFKIFESQLKDRDNLFKEIDKAIKKIFNKFEKHENKFERIEANFDCIKEGNLDLVDLKGEDDEDSSEYGLNLDNFIKDEKYYREKINEEKSRPTISKNDINNTNSEAKEDEIKEDSNIEDEVSEESVVVSEYQEIIKSDGEVEVVKVLIHKPKKEKNKKIKIKKEEVLEEVDADSKPNNKVK